MLLFGLRYQNDFGLLFFRCLGRRFFFLYIFIVHVAFGLVFFISLIVFFSIVCGRLLGNFPGRTLGFGCFGNIEIPGERVFGNGLRHKGRFVCLMAVIHTDGLCLAFHTLGLGVHVHGELCRIIEDVCDGQDDGVNYEWTHSHFAFWDETS